MEHLRQLQDDGGGSKGKCSNFSFLFFFTGGYAWHILFSFIYINGWVGGGKGMVSL